MTPKATAALDAVPLRNAKAELKRGETPLQKLNPAAGEALEAAKSRAKLEPKWMADEMGVSHSLTLRALKSKDDLGFHRLWELPDAFWLELLIAIAEQRGLLRVRRRLILDVEKSA